jgi:hypothetical protein
MTLIMMAKTTPTFQSHVDLLWPLGPIHLRDGPHCFMDTVKGNEGNGLPRIEFPAPGAAQSRISREAAYEKLDVCVKLGTLWEGRYEALLAAAGPVLYNAEVHVPEPTAVESKLHSLGFGITYW